MFTKIEKSRKLQEKISKEDQIYLRRMRKIDKIFDFEVACDVNDGQLRKVIESNLGVVVGVDLSSFSS
jgi:predicted RNase H-related nuclease YkuK (DUF458 family)